MRNKIIINLTNPTNNTGAANKAYVDTGFLKLSGGNLTGALYLKTTSQVTLDEALNVKTATAYFAQMGNAYVETRINIVNHKILEIQLIIKMLLTSSFWNKRSKNLILNQVLKQTISSI